MSKPKKGNSTIGLYVLKKIVPKGDNYSKHQELLEDTDVLDTAIFGIDEGTLANQWKSAIYNVDVFLIRPYLYIISETIQRAPEDYHLVKDIERVCNYIRDNSDKTKTAILVPLIWHIRKRAREISENYLAYKQSLLDVIGGEIKKLDHIRAQLSKNTETDKVKEETNNAGNEGMKIVKVKKRKKKIVNIGGGDGMGNTEKLEKEKKEESIFALYPEYTEEQVLEAINCLSEANKYIVEHKYGLNGKSITKAKDIMAACNIKKGSYGSRWRSIKESIAKHLARLYSEVLGGTEVKKPKTRSLNLFDSYPNNTEEEVLHAISLLTEQNRRAIELRYGLNGNPCTSIADIALELGETEKQITARLGNSKKRIADILSGKKLRNSGDSTVPKEKKEKIEKTLFEYFPGYTEEQVLHVISLLPEPNKQIIELRYGLNGNAIHSAKDIASMLNMTYSVISVRIPNIRTSIAKKLSKMYPTGEESLETALEPGIEIAESVIEPSEEVEVTLTTQKVTIPDIENFELYKDQFRVLIGLLSDVTEQTILLLRLGYIRNQCHSEEKIGNFLGIPVTEVNQIIHRGLANMAAISSIALNSVESARELVYTKEEKDV